MKRIDVRKSKRKSPFDPEVFWARRCGRAIVKYKKDHALFVQGGPADQFSISGMARSKSPLFPSKAKKPSSRSWDRTNSAAKDV